jgi:gliding motility-associated-like protein
MKTLKLFFALFMLLAGIYACGKDDDPITNDANIIIPNYFSPDGDGIDEFWMVKDSLNLIDNRQFNVKIYDTVHHLVFEKSDKNIPWNGTDENAAPLEMNYYYYAVKYKTWTGVERLRTGTVFLFRKNP